MNRRAMLAAAITAPFAAAFAPVPFRKPDARKLLAVLQGTWEMTRGSDTGGPWDEGTRIFVRVRGRTWMYVFTSEGDESEGTPSEIALAAMDGVTAIDLTLVAFDRSTVLKAIVKVEGGVLTVCHSPDTGERPTAFSGWSARKGGKEFSGRTMTFKRVR